MKLSKTRMCCVSSLAWIIDSLGLIWLQSLKNWRTYRFQEFDLIHRCLCVMFCTLHYLHSNKPLHPVTTEKATFAKRKRQFASGVTVDSANAEKNSVWRIWSKECIILDVPGQPHGREVAPAQFADDMIFSVVKISHFYMVVTTYRKTYIPHIESSQLSETFVKLELMSIPWPRSQKL